MCPQQVDRPIGLSDRALAMVQRHAAALPVDQRDKFLRDVAARLTGEASDIAVSIAVNIALDRREALRWR